METIAVKALGLRNAARGITPTATTFDENPSNLANATDGSPTTVTGVGSKTLGGSGTVGFVYVDLGSAKTVLFGAKVGMYSSAGKMSVFMSTSTNGSDYYVSVGDGVTSTTEKLYYPAASIVNARYLQLQFYVNAAATASVKIYEIKAYELGE